MGPILAPFFFVSLLALAEEARFQEAETLFLQDSYPKALGIYQHLVQDFPKGKYCQEANHRLFHIANYWLDDTREEMKVAYEKGCFQADVFRFSHYFHLDRTKPFINAEDLAIQTLQQVYQNDPDGPLAIKSLFYMGTVRFFREDYQEAERHYLELFRKNPQSPYAPGALKHVILCKIVTINEDQIDRKKIQEARDYIRILRRDYPDYAAGQEDFLNRQIHAIQLLEEKQRLENPD